jgi:teichoic acid transport system permease protein
MRKRVAHDQFADVARAHGLDVVGGRPPFRHYVAETWRRRSFAVALARYRIQSDNERNRLGVLWVVIRPLLNAAVYGLVFGFILRSDTRPDNFVPFLLVGVFVFEFFSNSLGQGSKAITSNSRLVQSMSFPRVLLPLSVLLEQAFRLIPILVVLAVLLLVFAEPLSWTWLLMIPIMGVMALFNAGVAMIAARLSVHIRDLQQVIPFVSRLLFYTSGIFFSLDLVLASRPDLLAIVHFLPTYEFITLSRDVLITGNPASPVVWIAAPIWAIVMLVVGFIFFWRAEERYGLDD